MTDQIEIADGLRGHGSYPAHWGIPEGTSQSEERTSWVAGNIATDQTLRRRGLNPAEVRSGKPPRTLSGHEALARAQAAARQ